MKIAHYQAVCWCCKPTEKRMMVEGYSLTGSFVWSANGRHICYIKMGNQTTFCILQCFNRVLCPYLIQTGNIFLWMGFIFMMRSALCHSQPKNKIILAGFNTCYFLQINWEILEPASSSSFASQLLHSWLHCSRNGWAPRSVPICYQWPCISTWSIHQCQK